MPPRPSSEPPAGFSAYGGRTRIEEAIADVVRRQHRQITAAQLLAIGLSRGAIDRRSRNGRLHRVHQGVYSVGSPPASDLERGSAALLAGGAQAALHDPTALAMWDLGAFPFMPRVAVPADRRHPGILIHRLSAPLDPRDVRIRHGLRVTAPARTLLDAATSRTDRQLTRLVDDALRNRRLRLTRRELAEVIDRYPRHPGAAKLAAQAEIERNPTRSDFEVEFLEFCARHGLPTPVTNEVIAGHELDAFFPAEGLIVECDGWDFHRGRAAFETDRERDAAHLALGLPTVRVTKRRLRMTAEREAERLREILERRRQAA